MGPCRHYHRLEIQADAERPRAQRLPNGEVYTPPAEHHTQVSHYCYPDVGIEMTLGGTPVVACNRWRHPDMDLERLVGLSPRDIVARFPSNATLSIYRDCRAYLADVEAWEAALRADVDADAEAQRLIMESRVNAMMDDLYIAVWLQGDAWIAYAPQVDVRVRNVDKQTALDDARAFCRDVLASDRVIPGKELLVEAEVQWMLRSGWWTAKRCETMTATVAAHSPGAAPAAAMQAYVNELIRAGKPLPSYKETK